MNFLVFNVFRIFSGNTYYYETTGSTFVASTASVPIKCNTKTCGNNGTVIYAGNSCYCSCHNPLQCGENYLDISDCSCNICLSKTGNLCKYM